MTHNRGVDGPAAYAWPPGLASQVDERLQQVEAGRVTYPVTDGSNDG